VGDGDDLISNEHRQLHGDPPLPLRESGIGKMPFVVIYL
jgi:hypothetical protein